MFIGSADEKIFSRMCKVPWGTGKLGLGWSEHWAASGISGPTPELVPSDFHHSKGGKGAAELSMGCF